MAFLQQSFGGTSTEIYDVKDGITIIGRHEDCDIVIESPAVSRKHARIVFENQRYYMEDLRSRNGTSVNGRQIRQRMPLLDGDAVEISTLPFTFRSESAAIEESSLNGLEPRVVSISKTGSDPGDSIRRQKVASGDHISNAELGADPIREAQLIGKLHVADSGRAWPVTSNASLKLNHSLRLLHELRTSLGLDDVVKDALQVLFDVFESAERIAILLRDTNGAGVRVAAALSRHAEEEVQICLPVIRCSIHHADALLYVDHWKRGTSGDPESSVPTVRTILAVPLIGLSGLAVGAVQLDTTSQTNALNKDDLERMVVLGHVLAFAIEQARAIEQRIQQELATRSTQYASRLRSRMAPPDAPPISGYRMNHRLLATPDIAADLVDYTRLPDGRIACCLIDVPGRGQEAAGLMALLARLLMGAAIESGSPAYAIHDAERTLAERMPDVPRVVSLAVMILDPRRSSVTISVAGHCPLVMVNGNRILEPDTTEFAGPPIGSDHGAYTESELQLNDNDCLVLFTDGITKLESADGELMSRDELLDRMREATKGHLSAFDDRLEQKISEFRGDAPLNDDIAFVMVSRRAGADTIDAGGQWNKDLESPAG